MTPNHFTLAGYWEQGDTISHIVALVLLAMSLVSWFFILSKAYAALRIRRSAPAVQAFWEAPSMQDGVAALTLADPEQVFLPLAQQGAAQLKTGGRASLGGEMGHAAQVTRVLRVAIQNSTNRLEGGLTLLASIGATAPFVGLLGTVWGIYHALANVSASGTVQIDKVAGPVGEALIMTAIGLTVAIPAVLAYNGFNRVNRLTLAELDAFAHDLHAYLTKGGGQV
ncbi:MotA/TolQ/ExbB proton channel family protein [Duganella sp. BJB488]|uniref:MotA/TolQ/ExbB proton channel family protein n=1 Tax=unclassified Duganella TaxID=2636909 RepID=UPI000E356241|nr:MULTISPECIES: MotA/TolQ/ExbB proton channel family protein [unclassified Duganella]NVD68948.1 MotA/TolQ/ExbB proton channel family protein [Duganella sp. BJB1802]RFP16894.1 MotA/TolQ/ExbB proton channel family protein [Duganella sp. BJB489]RFP20688.1 MotA/TolQ/ExbB proton channel family protein [Duganella sp. BJB488]RFP32257.1 MotA/TolQ/ExbB proton channel family protein [Duganella sp. BJB480]